MIKKILLSALLLGAFAPVAIADDYIDDIYFNPKKDKNVGATKKNPNYIANFSDMDVDTYNLRGQYYSSPVDTIGAAISDAEDFVYTQQIQKYYNPTIVLDNSEVLADVLENSYGNVEIVFNGLTPAFMPVYGYGYGWPYYSGYYNPWSWSIGWTWGGWNFGWYDPWYWGPSYAWGPAWGPGWGPSWSWGPSWGWGGPSWGGPAWGGHHRHSTYSPNGNRPNRPSAGWAGTSRPGSNRVSGANGRPGNSSSDSRWGIGNNHRSHQGAANAGGNRQNAASNSNKGYTIGAGGHRYSGSGSTGTVTNRNNGATTNRNSGFNTNSSSGSHRNSGYTNNSVTTNRGTSTNSTRSYNSNSNSRSSGNGSFGSGSFGGGRSSGGGGARSGGGGGGRGGRR